jgi:flagellar biosynthesis/type III secretory pathway M-ring protein FliF/YscJ
MEKELFDRETVLDLTVNFIPLGILLVFVVLYLVFNPFGFGSVISSIQFAIIGAMFVALAALTYYSGAAVSRAENQMEAAAALEEDEETEELESGDDGEELEDEEPAELDEGDDQDGESDSEDGDGTASESDDEDDSGSDADDADEETA